MSTSLSPIGASGVRRAFRSRMYFKVHTKYVNSVAYFPDGRRIASAFSDKTVIIWDIASGRQDGEPLQHSTSVSWIAISPDGRRIASGLEKGVIVWSALTREVIHKIEGGVWRLAYSPDGRWIATMPSGNWGEIWLYDADTGRPGRVPLKCDGHVWCMAFSPDGSQIVAGSEDGSFEVIDISTGKSVLGSIRGHARHVGSVAYSPDGRLLVTGLDDNSIRVWDPKTGAEVGTPMLGHEGDVTCVSISADGRRIASGDYKKVQVWDLEMRLRIGDSFGATGRVQSVAFSPNGRYVISGGDNGVYLWDTKSLANQGPIPESPRPTARYHAPPSIAPVRDLSGIRQGFRQAVSCFWNALTTPQITVSLVEGPNDWLHANSSQILQVPSIHGKQRVQVDLIYPRLFVYTLEYLECFAPRWRI